MIMTNTLRDFLSQRTWSFPPKWPCNGYWSLLEIARAVGQMASCKAAGPDEVALELFKMGGDSAIGWLHRICVAIFVPHRPVSRPTTQRPVETPPGPTPRAMDRPGPKGQWDSTGGSVEACDYSWSLRSNATALAGYAITTTTTIWEIGEWHWTRPTFIPPHGFMGVQLVANMTTVQRSIL